MPKSDNVLRVSTSESSCSRGDAEVCSSKTVLADVYKFVVSNGASHRQAATSQAATGRGAAGRPEDIIAKAAEILEVPPDTPEEKVVTHPKIMDFIVETNGQAGVEQYKKEVAKDFKPAGPRDTTSLLSNYNIDDVLQRWAAEFQDFCNCPFSMIDFEQEDYQFGRACMPIVHRGNEAQVVFDSKSGNLQTVTRKCKTFACVLNTDYSAGKGKHWVCVFVDMRGDTWSVEYFNSAGNPPAPAVVRWMEKAAAALREEFATQKVETIVVSSICHQESNTECGVYVLYYIRTRLEGVPYTHYRKWRVDDVAMTKFREHLFSKL